MNEDDYYKFLYLLTADLQVKDVPASQVWGVHCVLLSENRASPLPKVPENTLPPGYFLLSAPLSNSPLLCQAGSPATTAVICASVRLLSSCRITTWFHCLNPPQGLDLCGAGRVIFKAVCGDRSICLSGLFLLSNAAWDFLLCFTASICESACG